MKLEIRWDDQHLLLAEPELEEEVRAGRIPADAEARTVGAADYLPLSRFPALRLALEAPDARFSAALRRKTLPIIPAALGLLLLAGACFDPRPLSVGWVPTLLDGRSWTVFSYPFAHVSRVHLLANLPIVLYSAWRVQRALGSMSSLLVASSGLLFSSAAVLLLGSERVAGASGLAWAYIAAQVVIGLRWGAAVPTGQRGFYGMGNLVLALPLFLAGFGAERVSQLAHAGGALGGGLACLLLAPESRVGQASYWKRRSFNMVYALILIGANGGLPALASAWRLHAGSQELPGTGLRIMLPRDMVESQDLPGLWARAPRESPKEAIFVEMSWGAGPRRSASEEWHWRTGAQITQVEEAQSLGDDWIRRHFRFQRDGLGWELVEHSLQRGEQRIRTGFLLRQDATATRRQYMEQFLGSLEVGDPPELQAARRQWEQDPDQRQPALVYVRELRRIGRDNLANQLIASMQ